MSKSTKVKINNFIEDTVWVVSRPYKKFCAVKNTTEQLVSDFKRHPEENTTAIVIVSILVYGIIAIIRDLWWLISHLRLL